MVFMTDLSLNDGSFESSILQNLPVLLEQLEKLVKSAKRIRSESFQAFEDELLRKLLWLRPSVNGISAISCCENTPQLGFSKISIRNLGTTLEKDLTSPKRRTPEKRLQSWLIHQALKSGGRLKVLEDLLGGQYWFVSDEIALKTGSKKVVADMLLVRVDCEGMASLVNAELKSKRSMETFRQVISFRDALECPGLQKSWREFANVMTGKSFQWNPSEETRGIVIWPAVENLTHARANTKRKDYERLDLIGYEDSGPNAYILEIEKPVGKA